jgi:hypothetical protein|tara:strand:+ start:992 stop:1117 length:126 start_codon:yes stop_codon:yes gene_type:complete
MKNKKRETTLLAALAYLLDRQNLTQEQMKSLVIKTLTEIEQ